MTNTRNAPAASGFARAACLSVILAACGGCEQVKVQRGQRAQQDSDPMFGRAVEMAMEADRPNEIFEDVKEREDASFDGGAVRRPVEVFRNPKTLDQVVFNLNQWIGGLSLPEGWTRDPILDTLPGDLRSNPTVYRVLNGLKAPKFSRDEDSRPLHDGWAIQEAIWLRNVSRRAQGDSVDELTRATNLFDWS
ncbi:MAG: hypothetical protein N2C14_06340, partial [Planctomycetales bacterium]